MRTAAHKAPWLVVTLLLLATTSLAADSFVIRADWFDRGNVDTDKVAKGYTGKYPCIANGSKYPNQAEYDVDFPAAAEYTIHSLYTAAAARPVDIYLDGKKLATGFTKTTGNWNTDHAKWFQECKVTLTAGKHTVKLQRQDCIPHICALRFDSPVAFPKDWALQRKVARKAIARAAGPAGQLPDQTKFLGWYPYDPPTSYDYRQPHGHVPLPTPRAHRILEYALMGGNYKVEATLVGPGQTAPATTDARRNELLQATRPGSEPTDGWVADLVAKAGDKVLDRDTLALSPRHLDTMLKHIVLLIGRFRDLPGAKPDCLDAERREAAHMASFAHALLTGQKDTPDKWQQFYNVYLTAYRLKNKVALSNPLIDFPSVVVAKRLTYNTSHIYTTYYDGSGRYKAGSGIYTLSPVRPDGKLTCLTPSMKPDAIYRDPDLSWDGSRVLFSCKLDRKAACHIYEVGTDGKGLRQLTKGLYDDVDPCILPDGQIAFISTRTERVTLCHNAFTVSNLHTMNADGSGIRCISTNTIHDFTPSVLADGQIAVSQWRYVDKHVGNNQSLWRCNPDGTRLVHVSGAHFGPVTLWGARQVPDSQKMACILGPHMPYAVGPVAVVDPMFTHTSPAAYTNLTPEIPAPSHASWQRPESGYYADVFPLSEDYFLVSYCYGPDNRQPTGYAIYLLDRWNNRDLVYRDPELSTFEVFPVKPRPRPQAIPPRSGEACAVPNHADPTQAKQGTFYVINVYEGLTGIQPGEVKYLRIIEEIPKPVASRTRGYGLQNPAISWRGHFALKRIWGTVPVEADGSAYFKAPASRALYFSALDKDYMEVQRMRSFVTVAPGESFGCVGCHERKTSSPPTTLPLAMARPPLDITPSYAGADHGPDFYHDAQPVLDKHCAKCHTGPKPKGGLDLSPEHTNIFNVAYESLMKRDLVSYVNIYQVSTLLTRPPKYFGSHASKLVQILRTTHKKRVQIPQEDWRRLVTWIDANAPYYGTYAYTRPNTVGGREIFAQHRGQLNDLYARRCQSCHGKGGQERHLLRLRTPDVAASRPLVAPLAKAAGGAATCKQATFASASDPDYQKLLGIFKAIAANPRVDMQPARPPLTDPKCRYVYRPGVTRERAQ
ncbi:MAG: carbohydrate-binding protein [Candidatus Brocadiae bacterium]|nr:carbohydrate-binding protein [Candidatus Brocadiia bacterium]